MSTNDMVIIVANGLAKNKKIIRVDNDFQILLKRHFEFKSKISEEASFDSINAFFEYDRVEYDGLMYAYNDVLPYGEQLTCTINGMD